MDVNQETYLRNRVQVLSAECDRLAARVRELEAEREAIGTEWGIRWSDGTEAMEPSEAHARKFMKLQRGTELIKRAAPGPWRVAT